MESHQYSFKISGLASRLGLVKNKYMYVTHRSADEFLAHFNKLFTTLQAYGVTFSIEKQKTGHRIHEHTHRCKD